MADGEDDLDIPKKSSMLPIVIAAVGALVVGAGAGFGAALVFAGGEEAEAAEGEADEPQDPIEVERDGETVVIEDPGAVYIHDLERFTINLRGGGGGRTLRMAVQLQSTARHQYDLQDAHPALRDAVLTLASDYTYGDVEGFDGKQRLKDDLLAAVTKVVDPDEVDRIFFTEFQVN